MADKRFIDEFGECVACGAIGVDLHHIKTQKTGGSDESWNLMPLCHPHHVMVHNIGLMKFSSLNPISKEKVNGRSVKEWLENNGWYIDPYMKRWVNDKNFNRE